MPRRLSFFKVYGVRDPAKEAARVTPYRIDPQIGFDWAAIEKAFIASFFEDRRRIENLPFHSSAKGLVWHPDVPVVAAVDWRAPETRKDCEFCDMPYRTGGRLNIAPIGFC